MTLILYKKLGMFNRYGYAPKGFLIDYFNPTLLKEFTDLLKKFLKSCFLIFELLLPQKGYFHILKFVLLPSKGIQRWLPPRTPLRHALK